MQCLLLLQNLKVWMMHKDLSLFRNLRYIQATSAVGRDRV